MKLEVFPEHFLRCMSKEDRRAIGQPTIRAAGGCAIVAHTLQDVIVGIWKARKGSCYGPPGEPEKENSTTT